MVCDTMLKPRQTAAQRKAEAMKVAKLVDKLIAQRKVGIIVGKQGGVTFTGISDSDRDGMSDACIYRIMTGKFASTATKVAIQAAERKAGRPIDRKVVASGLHSHDAGRTWSTH